MLYGFVVYGVILVDEFAARPDVFRPVAEQPLALGFAGSVVGAFVLAYVYAKGYEGSNGLQEGLRFGTLVGLLMVGEAVFWNHVVLRVSGAFTAALTLAALIQYILMGIAIGVVYRTTKRAR
jgi:hypothetical protein